MRGKEMNIFFSQRHIVHRAETLKWLFFVNLVCFVGKKNNGLGFYGENRDEINS
jgi:hypothetical protein